MLVTEKHVEFLKARGYEKTLEEAHAFVARFNVDDLRKFQLDFSHWSNLTLAERDFKGPAEVLKRVQDIARNGMGRRYSFKRATERLPRPTAATTYWQAKTAPGANGVSVAALTEVTERAVEMSKAGTLGTLLQLGYVIAHPPVNPWGPLTVAVEIDAKELGTVPLMNPPDPPDDDEDEASDEIPPPATSTAPEASPGVTPPAEGTPAPVPETLGGVSKDLLTKLANLSDETSKKVIEATLESAGEELPKHANKGKLLELRDAILARIKR